ncbi:MAG TPA: hypothetical protein VM305_04895 [Candidatus Limnocylindrales bacterium]|nr:hypothetical protein [Candidatus Limnocylindrales bacterium]
MQRLATLALVTLLAAACTGVPGVPPSPSPGGSGAVATPDPEAELRRIIELREEWGLRADRQWIEQVEADPGSILSKLGIRVTGDENAGINTQMSQGGPRMELVAYGAREHDTFGGLWMEGATVVMCFTARLEEHRRAAERLAPLMDVDVRHCPNTEAALKAVMQAIVDDMAELQALGFQVNSVGLDTMSNVVQLEARTNLANAAELLRERYGDLLRADIHPLPAAWHNRLEGPGWRLLAAGINRDSGLAYTAEPALDEASYEALWERLDPFSERPAVDVDTEMVAVFVQGIGSSCQEVRLDEVVIDHANRRVFSVTSDPLGPRPCTADLVGGAFFLVALQREALPESPFRLQLSEQPLCADCEPVLIDLR